MNKEDHETGIAVHVSTKDKLYDLKLVSMESYENVVLRLIEDFHKHHKPRDPVDPTFDAYRLKQEA